MTDTPSTPTATPPTRPELARVLTVALAQIRQVGESDLEAERAGGDLEMASPEAIAAISAVEHHFGRRLAKVEDLEPEQLTSLVSLTELLYRRWPNATHLQSGSQS
jgi:hypothetical protein